MGDRAVLVDPDQCRPARLAACLDRPGWDVTTTSSARHYFDRFGATPHDVVIADEAVPDVPIDDFCRRVRDNSDVALVVVADDPSPTGAVLCLEAGADKYLEKNQDPAEFVSRLRSLLRRTGIAPSRVVRTGGIEIDIDRLTARCNGNDLCLTVTELNLLIHLARSPDAPVTHASLLKAVWGRGCWSERDVLTQAIRRLRMKLDGAADGSPLITAVRGVGYRLTIR